MKRLVADTGPVLHLHEADALHLLPLIGEIFLPPLVAAELRSRISVLPKWAKVQALSSSANNARWNGGARDCCTVVKPRRWLWRANPKPIGFSPMMRRRD
jgi:hypothetical protein